MGDSYEAVVDAEATPETAAGLGQRVVERLSGEGIILPSLDPDSVLGDKGGYRPGHRIDDLYCPCPPSSTHLLLTWLPRPRK